MKKKIIFGLFGLCLLFGGIGSVSAASTGYQNGPSALVGQIGRSSTYSLRSMTSNINSQDIILYHTSNQLLPSSFINSYTRKEYIVLYEKDTFSSTAIKHCTLAFAGREVTDMIEMTNLNPGIVESDGTAELYLESVVTKESGDPTTTKTGSNFRFNLTVN